MKTKLTLSVSRPTVVRIKAYCAKHGSSVSEFFEEVVAQVTQEKSKVRRKKSSLVDLIDGLLEDKFSDEQIEQDPRLKKMLGR